MSGAESDDNDQQTTEQREAPCIGCKNTISRSNLDPLPDDLSEADEERFDGECPNCGLLIWFEAVDAEDARRFGERLAEVTA